MSNRTVPKLQHVKEFLDDPQLKGKIIFASKDPKNSNRLSYALLEQETVNDYRIEFVNYLSKFADKDPVEYGLSDFESDTYQYLNATYVPNATALLDEPRIALSSLSPEFIKSIKFTQFRFNNAEGEVIGVFKIYIKTGFLTSENRFKFFLKDTILTPFTKDLIVAPPKFDCILFRNIVYIFKRSNFEKIFDYKRVFEEKAREVFAYFEKPRGYRIKGLDEIKAKCMGNNNKMRKLAIISQGVPYKSITFEQAQSFCKAKGLTDPAFDRKKKIMKFQTTRAFFRLFDEDYVRGELTNTEYISTRKTKFRSSKK